jgi:hypothetical protein
MMDYNFLIKNCFKKCVDNLFSPRELMFYFNTYLKAGFIKSEPDSYIVSYPKCGRTWLRVMLSEAFCLFYDTKDFDIEVLNKNESRIKVAFDHDCSNWVPAPKDFKSLKFNKNKFGNKRVIFIVRDLRDILVSSYMHLKYREKLIRSNISKFIRDDFLGIQKVINFMNLWYHNRDIPCDFMMISYEQLHMNSVDVLKNILQFLNLEIPDDMIFKSVNFSSFENMQKMERENINKIPWLKAGDRKDIRTYKTRKGEIGSFKDELGMEDTVFLNDMIKNNLDRDLIRFIYNNNI